MLTRTVVALVRQVEIEAIEEQRPSLLGHREAIGQTRIGQDDAHLRV